MLEPNLRNLIIYKMCLKYCLASFGKIIFWIHLLFVLLHYIQYAVYNLLERLIVVTFNLQKILWPLRMFEILI